MHIVLSSRGASITRNQNRFLVKTGDVEQFLHPSDVKTISISKSANISSDAILLAIENEIDVFFVDTLGQPVGKIWSVKYGSISTIRQKQIEFLYTEKSVQWIKDLIVQKINNQISVLLTLVKDDEVNSSHDPDKMAISVHRAIRALRDYANKIQNLQGEHISEIAPQLRGWEGASAKKYFQTFMQFIPEPYTTSKRSLHPPEDPFNATLSYAYGILYSRCESALIKAGIDPYVGIYHRDNYNRPALVFDFIEKFRFWADYVCIHLFLGNAFIDECFTMENNVCYLDTLGKRILIQSMNDYLAEIILLNGKEKSRLSHIQDEAHALAQMFLNA